MSKQIEALRRGLVILDLLSMMGPLSLASLARESLLPKPTVLRILSTLEATGHARRGLSDGLWRATSSRHKTTGAEHLLAEVCAPVLDSLCHRVLWPSDVGVYREGAVRVLETSRRLSPFLVNRTIAAGVHVLPSAMGRAIIAFTSEAHRAAILNKIATQRNSYDKAALDRVAVEHLIEETREKGYGARAPGYFISKPREATVSAIAVPVLRDDIVVAAVNISWISSAASEIEFAAQHLDDLEKAASDIAKQYGMRSR